MLSHWYLTVYYFVGSGKIDLFTFTIYGLFYILTSEWAFLFHVFCYLRRRNMWISLKEHRQLWNGDFFWKDAKFTWRLAENLWCHTVPLLYMSTMWWLWIRLHIKVILILTAMSSMVPTKVKPFVFQVLPAPKVRSGWRATILSCTLADSVEVKQSLETEPQWRHGQTSLQMSFFLFICYIGALYLTSIYV